MKKYNKNIPGVLRCYNHTSVSGFVVYGKLRPKVCNGVVFVSMRYNAFGIENGEIKQVKRLSNAVQFNRKDLNSARKFAALCEHMHPEYTFHVREYVH